MLMSIKALYKLTNALSLTPLFDFKNCSDISNTCYKNYSFFMIVAISGSYIYHAFYFYPYSALWDMGNYVISTTMAFLLHAFNLLLVINQVIRKKTEWIVFLQLLYETKLKNTERNPHKSVILLIYITLGILLVYEFMNWYKFYPKTNFFAFTLVNVQEVELFIMISLVSYLALLIKQRFKFLCETIMSFETNMEFITKSYLQFINIVECFNEIFGVCLFIYFGVLLLGFLDCLNILLNREVTSLTILDVSIVTLIRLVS